MQGMMGMGMGEFARDVGVADPYWRTDSVIRDRVFPPGLVLIPLIVLGE